MRKITLFLFIIIFINFSLEAQEKPKFKIFKSLLKEKIQNSINKDFPKEIEKKEISIPKENSSNENLLDIIINTYKFAFFSVT